MELQKETRSVSSHPDQGLQVRIQHDLAASGYLALKQVRVIVDQRRVFLTGCVPTWFMKQVAQTRVQLLEGVDSVTNDLVVEDHWDHD